MTTRVFRGAWLLMYLLAGCMAEPYSSTGKGPNVPWGQVLPNVTITSEPGMLISSPLSSPEGPAASPSAVIPSEAPCDPGTGPLLLVDDPQRAATPDAALLRRCDGALFHQAIGQKPVALAWATKTLTLAWVAADGHVAIGTRMDERTGRSLLVERRTSGEETPLADQVMGRPVVSPDGRRVAFYRMVPTGPDVFEPVLTWYDRDTRSTRAIGGASGDLLQWSPDSRKLLVTSPASGELIVADEGGAMHLAGTYRTRYDAMYDQVSWAPDGTGLLLVSQNPKLPDNQAELLTLDLKGDIVSDKGLVDDRGGRVRWFLPHSVSPYARLVIGEGGGYLDIDTGVVRAFPLEGDVLGWSNEPGKVLRWRSTPEGPALDTIAVP